MFYLIHALLGALIATNIHSVLLIIIICLASHFLLDMIPHWDGSWDKKLFHLTEKISIKRSTFLIHSIDFLIFINLIYLLYFLFGSKLVVLAAFVSVLPDMMKMGYYTKLRQNKRFMKYLRFHSKIQREVGWKLGLLTQLIILIVILEALF